MATAIVYNTTAPATKVMSRNAKLITAQRATLANAGLNYEEVFSVDYADFGTDLLDQLLPRVEEIAAKVASVHVQAGFPEERVNELVAHIVKSFAVTAGLNEAARSIGIATYEEQTGEQLPAGFFGTADKTEATPANRESMEVGISF